jgi:hypothetical protein
VIFYRILHDDPDTEAVPESLKPLVSAALAKKPGDRPTAQDLLNALAAGPGEAPAAAAPDAALQAMLSRTWAVPARKDPEPTFVRRRRRQSLMTRHPFLLPVAGVAAVLVCGGVALGVSGTGQPAAQVVATPSSSMLCGLGTSLYSCLPTSTNNFTYSGPPTSQAPYVPEPTAPLALSTITPVPFGPCQAGCPSFMPTPNATVSGQASSDDLWLEQNGYQPLQNLGWRESYNSLNVILARKFGSTSGGTRAFFFDQDSYMTTDVPQNDGSNSVQAFRLAEDTIDLRYRLANAASGTADVRFRLVNNNLIRLDPMPPAQYRSW